MRQCTARMGRSTPQVVQNLCRISTPRSTLTPPLILRTFCDRLRVSGCPMRSSEGGVHKALRGTVPGSMLVASTSISEAAT